MKKKWVLAISLALVLAMVSLAGCNQPTGVPSNLGLNLYSQQEGIWVSGTGEVTAIPDIATLRLGIEAQEATVAEAQSKANDAMNKVMDALTDNEIAEKDIQTQRFSIQRITRWDSDKEEEIVIGYRVTNMVIAKIRDIDNTGIIIDAVAGAGGDLTRIDSIAFSIDDPSVYYEEAREKAMADAEDKAKQLAKLGGVSLGKPTYISESSYTPPTIYLDRAEAMPIPAPAPAPPPISAGEMEISITVQVVYAILN
jgi:uncharacterized protein YggE